MLVTLIVAMLCVPSFLSRVKTLKFPGGELELLEKLQEDAEKNKQELDDIRFVLTLLLAPTELQHLKNLKIGQTQQYVGRGSVRSELRRLRTLGLVQNRERRGIGELEDGKALELAQLLSLTDRGRHYLERLEADT